MALTLILMRHAKSSWSSVALADHDRPLNERGYYSAKVLGAWLREKDLEPKQALVSSAKRTQETFAGLSLGIDPEILGELYHASSDQLLESISQAESDRLLVVAHNPGIGELAFRLARMMGERPDHTRFDDYPTGATFVIEYPGASWKEIDFSQGRIIDFIVPREL